MEAAPLDQRSELVGQIDQTRFGCLVCKGAFLVETFEKRRVRSGLRGVRHGVLLIFGNVNDQMMPRATDQ